MNDGPAKRPTKKAAKAKGASRMTQQRSIDTQDRILEAAAEEFVMHGFTGTSTRVVAARASVYHPVITHYFGDKDGLWRAVMRGLNETVLETLKSRLQAFRGVDTVTTLRLIMEDFIRFSAANPKFHRLMDHAAGNGGERMNWLADEFVKEFFRVLVPLIQAAQKHGGFMPGDAHHLVYLFIGATTRLFMLAPEVKRISGHSPMTTGYIQEHVSLCLALFFREPPIRSRSASSSRRYRESLSRL
jgi:TetR/AcrR family transcriptional regulator